MVYIIFLTYSLVHMQCAHKAEQQQRRVMTKGDVLRGEDEKNDEAKWQEDENGLMCGDSYKIRMRKKMSRYEWMIDRAGEWEHK